MSCPLLVLENLVTKSIAIPFHFHTATNTYLLNHNTSYQPMGVQSTSTYGLHPLSGFSPHPSKRFLRLAGFLRAAAGTENEQAKNFQWGLRRSTLNHLMCMSYTDVAQVANAARNYEILHERDDEDTERPDKRGVVIGIRRPLSRVVTGATVANAACNYEILHERDDEDIERPDKRQRSGDRHQLTTQQSSHRSHGHHNDRHGSDRRGGSDNHRSSNNNYSGSNNRIECMRATPTANLPYGMFLTRLYLHIMETYPHLDNGIYDIVERAMRPLALNKPDDLEVIVARHIIPSLLHPLIIKARHLINTMMMMMLKLLEQVLEEWSKAKRSSFARAMIELRAGVELKGIIMVDVVKLVDVLKNLKTPRQAAKGVQVCLKVGFKPTKQVYQLVSKMNCVNQSGKKKQVGLSTQEVGNSNPFVALNSVENDNDLGTNGGNLKLSDEFDSHTTKLITERINNIERKIVEVKLMLVDDD
nr:zinc finger, CCHC-type, retrotransposon Gag domain protein [Tanacetum cinerariifolium]